jgi:anti-sigma factor RsiW
MMNHLTDAQIEGYWARQLAAADLLAVEQHMSTCKSCRERVAGAAGMQTCFSALKAGLDDESASEPEHLTFEQMLAYAEETLDEAECDIVTSHLAVCDLCTREAADIRTFRSAMAASPARQYSLGLKRTLREQLVALLRRRRAVRYALALAAAGVLVLFVNWATMRPLKHQMADLRRQMEGPRQVLLYPVPIVGDFPVGASIEAQIEALNETTGQRFERVVYSRVSNDNTLPPAIALDTPAKAIVALELLIREGPGAPARRYVGLTRLFPIQNTFVVRVAPVDLAARNPFVRSIFRAYKRFTKFVDSSSADKIQDAIESEQPQWLELTAQTIEASLNFFDDVEVYAGRKVFVDQDFDGYAEGRRALPNLRPSWSGRDGYVTYATHAPKSGPACWASESYPNWSRQDVVAIDPKQIPSGKDLTFEASIYLTDPAKGARIGLTRPVAEEQTTGEPYVAQNAIAMIVLKGGELMIQSGREIGGAAQPRPALGPGLLDFEADSWHRLKVVCDPRRNTMDISLDGRWVRNQKMTAPLADGVLLFSIGGAHFAETEL